MSREEKVSVVEAYLDCFTTKDLSKLSFADDVTFEGTVLLQRSSISSELRLPRSLYISILRRPKKPWQPA
jgi:hypothetical protein